MADRRVEDVQKRLNHEREDTARRIAAAINTEREVHTHTHTHTHHITVRGPCNVTDESVWWCGQRANIEREAWQHRQMNQLKKEAKEAEKETKASLIRQRDEQVKMVRLLCSCAVHACPHVLSYMLCALLPGVSVCGCGSVCLVRGWCDGLCR